MTRFLTTGTLAIALASLAACSGAYPGSSGSYASAADGRYTTRSDAAVQAAAGQQCPGTNEADAPWQPGEYCLPGGR